MSNLLKINAAERNRKLDMLTVT